MDWRDYFYVFSLVFMLAAKFTPLIRGKYSIKDIEYDAWFILELFICFCVPQFAMLLIVIGFIINRKNTIELLKEWFLK